MTRDSSKKLTYISLFSGIEAASVAWEPLGFQPIAFAEVDPFPSAVLKERYPHVPNLGDITKIDWSEYRGNIDIVVGGSPCQSFSIAGKREGLAGASGLMFEYIRAVREIRPRFFLWENVPGALSSETGEAFKQLLSEMDDLGYGLAWRVLDAQFTRVPNRKGVGFIGPVAQRRRRVFLVGSLGNTSASEILFEPDCLRWNHPSSREQRESLAREAKKSAGSCCESRVYCIQGDIARGAHMGQNGKGWSDTGETYTLNTMDVPAVAAGFKYNQGAKAGNIGYKDGQAPTLTADGHHPPAVAYAMKIRCGCAGGGKGPLIQEDMSATLATGNDQTLFVPYTASSFGQYLEGETGTLRASGGDLGGGSETLAATSMQVRKLTPRECERLQGFPDDWTKVSYKGKPEEECPDGPRYKAIGNSMAVPVMRLIGERILRVSQCLDEQGAS